MSDALDDAISAARRLVTAELADDTKTMRDELVHLKDPGLVIQVLVQALAATFQSDDPDDRLKTWRQHLLEADLNSS